MAKFLLGFKKFVYLHTQIGHVAQLDRASDYGSEGWGFDSFRGHRSLFAVCEEAFLFSKNSFFEWFFSQNTLSTHRFSSLSPIFGLKFAFLYTQKRKNLSIFVFQNQI